jgi:hypothetical protein
VKINQIHIGVSLAVFVQPVMFGIMGEPDVSLLDLSP